MAISNNSSSEGKIKTQTFSQRLESLSSPGNDHASRVSKRRDHVAEAQLRAKMRRFLIRLLDHACSRPVR